MYVRFTIYKSTFSDIKFDSVIPDTHFMPSLSDIILNTIKSLWEIF
jgi:hypothetical protein